MLRAASRDVREPGTPTDAVARLSGGLDRFRQSQALLRRVGERPPTFPPACRVGVRTRLFAYILRSERGVRIVAAWARSVGLWSARWQGA